MQGSKKQDKKTKVIEILEKNGWSSDYPQVKQVKLYRDDVELKRSNIIALTDKEDNYYRNRRRVNSEEFNWNHREH